MLLNTVSRKERDLLTPHKISLVLLIQKYGTLRPKFWGTEGDNDSSIYTSIISKSSPKERKAICILISKLTQGNDLSLTELIELITRSHISRIYLNLFNSGSQELYRNGVDSLLGLFDEVEKFCKQDPARSENSPCIWTSLVGLHLRQLNLAFHRLGFYQVVSLYQKYRLYYELHYKDGSPAVDAPLSSKMPEKDNNLDDDADQDMDVTLANNENIDTFLQDPSDKLDDGSFQLMNTCDYKHGYPVMSISNRQQAELFIQEQIALLLQQNPSAIPPAQLQEAISALLKNCPDLGKAHFLTFLNCLRVREQAGAIHSLVKAYDSKIMHKEVVRGEDFTRTFRYAALNMASLQAQFGHRELGLMYLEEAIRLAQESNDHTCLQYALAWLYTLSTTMKTALIKRSIKRSNEMNLPYLNWLSLFNCAKELSRIKVPPAEILKKLLVPSQQQNRSQSSVDSSFSGQSGIWGVQAGLWALWGNPHLTAICSQILLRLAPQMNINLQSPSMVSLNCAALCNMAIILANLGENKLSSEMLQFAEQQFPHPWEHAKLWMSAKNCIAFYDALRQGLWSRAKAVSVNMATVHPTYSKLMEAELLVARGEYSQSLNIVESLKRNCINDGCEDVILEPEILVKTILVEAMALSAGNNLGVALSTLVKGISLAQEYHMIYLLSLGHLHIASVQMHLGLLKEANASLQMGLDIILSNGEVYDQARAKLLQAKFMVCSADKDHYCEVLNSAAEDVNEAQNLFARVKAYSREKEAAYLKARMYHACGNIEARNKSALIFRQLEQQHPSQPVIMNTCLF